MDDLERLADSAAKDRISDRIDGGGDPALRREIRCALQYRRVPAPVGSSKHPEKRQADIQ